MKLYKIDIEKFRGFSKFVIEDFKKINLIVGKNNSGKTSLLEAIFFAIGISNPNLSITIDNLRGLIHDKNDDFRFIFHNLDYSEKIKIESEFINKAQFRKLLIRPIFDKTNDIDSYSTKTEKKVDGVEFNFSTKSIKKAKDKFKKSTLQLIQGKFEIKNADDYKEMLQGRFLNQKTSSLDIYKELDNILINKGEGRIIKALQNIDRRICGISLGINNMIYFDIGIKKLIPYQLMGDGIIRLLSIIVSISQTENGILMIDEIENGFHYSILNKLWQSVYETAIQYNVQIFITTHSFECAKAFGNIDYDNKFKEDNLRIFRIENNNDNEFKSIKFDTEDIGSSFESNWEIR